MEVTLDNNRLNSMLRDPFFMENLPCLETLQQLKQAQQPKKKGCCNSGGGNAIPHSQYDQVRRCISGLLKSNAGVRNRVKQKLGAETLRIKYAGTNKLITDKV